MIAISSHRPLKDCSPDILRNQLRARASWERNFEGIIYFGDPESALSGPKVHFVERVEQFPPIFQLMKMASSLQDWSAIINADIFVGDGLPLIQSELIKRGALCAMSRRFEFQGENIREGRMIDNGLDFFAAAPTVWKLAAAMVPKQYRIGNILWDTWLLGFLASHCYQVLWDITECRVIFHPKHEDRRRIFDIDQSAGKAQLDKVQWPAVERRLYIKSVADATGTQPNHFSP